MSDNDGKDPQKEAPPPVPQMAPGTVVADVHFKLTAGGHLMSNVTGPPGAVILAIELGKAIEIKKWLGGGRGPDMQMKKGRVLVPGGFPPS